MIELEEITFAYARHQPVFEGYSWQVAQRESWAVIGPSGCGKTTLLYLLAGLRQPQAGSIEIAGQVIEHPRPQTGLILQDHGLLPWANVDENARLGLTIRAMYGPDGRHAPADAVIDREAASGRVDHWLQRLGIADLRDKYPGQLSGGQRQRTAIARTLALEPNLLLMDEPFSALDAPTREDLQRLIVELRREANLTSVIVTHNIDEALYLGRKLLVLGQPPNRTPVVFENPFATRPDRYNQPGYQTLFDRVRAELGNQHEAAV
jgi:ABC-type nitrate/sulfonate/bicarbonate transport system ATPase subunit